MEPRRGSSQSCCPTKTDLPTSVRRGSFSSFITRRSSKSSYLVLTPGRHTSVVHRNKSSHAVPHSHRIHKISTQDRTHANKPRNEHTSADTKAHSHRIAHERLTLTRQDPEGEEPPWSARNLVLGGFETHAPPQPTHAHARLPLQQLLPLLSAGPRLTLLGT